MPIEDYPTLQAKTAAPWQRLSIVKGSTGGIAFARMSSLWQNGPSGGSVPSTALAPSRTTAGALPNLFDSAGTQRLTQVTFNYGYAYNLGGSAILVDRLSHQGGLSGAASGAQTTNLPTASLTRYTDGVGVIAALEIYSALGATGVTATVSYTNENGTSGRTSQAVPIGGSGNMEALAVIPITLAAGDAGVRAVSSVTLSGSGTGAAGNFGVTLYKPLMIFPLVYYPQSSPVFDSVLEMYGQMPQVVSGACLSWLFFPTINSSGQFNAELRLIEE